MAIQRSHAIGTLVLGVCELICGILIIILAVVAANKANVGAGVAVWWAGLVFAIPGIIGIVVGITKNNGAMVAFMILNIIAFVLQGISAILAGIVIAIWASAISDLTDRCDYVGGTCKCTTDSGDKFEISGVKESCEEISSLFSVLTAMMVFLVIAAIIALSASILGCVVVCCSRNTAQPGIVLAQPTMQQPTMQQAPPAYYNHPQPVKQ